jgi:hypothetical protein
VSNVVVFPTHNDKFIPVLIPVDERADARQRKPMDVLRGGKIGEPFGAST